MRQLPRALDEVRRPRRAGPGEPDPRAEILALQRALYLEQRRLIAHTVEGYTPEFRRYEAEYRRHVQGYEAVGHPIEVARDALDREVVFVGDYHTLKQAQRAFLKLAVRLQRRRPLVLALEFVQGRYQRSLDDWLRGRIGDRTFLRRIAYRSHQVFDVWPNFRPILELARKHRIPVAAIDLASGPEVTLAERDRYAARRIVDAALAHPGHTVLALVGQLHVAPPHLPLAVREESAARGRPLSSLVVYQNAEEIWFALERAGLHHDVEAVRLRDGEWCLVNTSPLVGQQSYLDWLEVGGDGDLLEASAPEHSFKQLARLVARFLGVDIARELDEVEVYSLGDLSFLALLRARGFSADEIAAVKRQILARESYYIPRARIAYLATLSVNHAAEEASHFVRHVMAGDEHEDARGLADAFYARVMNEALAFFGSKVVNPRRKCAHAPRFRLLLRSGTPAEKRLARWVLPHLDILRGSRRPGAARIPTADPDLWNGVSHALGYVLGEKLYYALVAGHVTKAEVRRLFADPLDEPGAALTAYLLTAGRVGRQKVPRRS